MNSVRRQLFKDSIKDSSDASRKKGTVGCYVNDRYLIKRLVEHPVLRVILGIKHRISMGMLLK